MHVHVLRITSCMSLHPVSRGVGDCRKSAEGPLNWSVLFVANITTIGKAEGQMMSSSSRSFRRSYLFSSLCSNSLTIFQPDNWVISGKNGTDVTLVDFGRSVDLSKAGGGDHRSVRFTGNEAAQDMACPAMRNEEMD